MRTCAPGQSRRWAALLACSIALAPVRLEGQCAPGASRPPASSRAIVGLVTDKGLNPIRDARVFLGKPRLETSTDQEGRFRIEGLSRGEYELTIRKIGFELERVKTSIGDSGAVVRLCMTTAVRPLPAMITAAHRAGLSGFVADAAHRPVAGAEVRTIGNGMSTTTDSTGAFYLGVKSGHYAVTVIKDGYGKQLLGVTIPPDSGREIAVWLAAPPRNANAYAAELSEMHERSIRIPSSRYAIRTEEDLMRSRKDLQQEIFSAARGVGRFCSGGLQVIGQTYDIPVDMVDKTEIAMLEVITVIPGRPGQRGAPCVRAMVWLKP